jgi:hypothetical protein
VEGIAQHPPGGLPAELGGAALAAARQAGGDQGVGHTGAARRRRHVQVVHHPDAGGEQGLPGPQQGGEAERRAVLAARQELEPLAGGVGQQRPRLRQQRGVAGATR